jgi:hypothetical protein
VSAVEGETTYREGREWARGTLGVVGLGGALASAGLTYRLPLSVITKVQAFTFQLVTAGGGGNRQVVALLRDGFGVTVYAVPAPGVQAGGLTVVYSFGNLVTAFGTAALGFMGGPFPGGWLPENLELAAVVGNTDPADVITDARLLVRQRPSTPGDSE